jgi:hypothetical protein
MMLAMLGAFQGVAAACAEVCIQRMQLLHLELTNAMEHEAEEAEVKAKRDGHPSSAPIAQSLVDALGRKTSLGPLCHQESCMPQVLASIYKLLGESALPQNAELLKFVTNTGSGAMPACREQFRGCTPSPTEFHISREYSDPTKHDIPILTPRGSDSNWTNLSETESKTESKTDWHNSASSTQEQIPQTPPALPHHGNRYEMAAAPGASLWTTGGAYQESSCSGNSGSDIFLHQQKGSMSVPMRGSIPVHAQPLQSGLQLSGRHASIREAEARAKEQHAREQVQQLAKDQNFFFA